jgi:hypothetical protein
MWMARFLPQMPWLVLLLIVGCEAESQTHVAVRGRVFYHGVPLTSGLIVFAPDSTRGSDGPLARAEIQSDGSYELHVEGATGVSPGWYRVTVMALESVTPVANGTPAVPRSLLPDKYRDPELSGLVREVKSGQDNILEFRLE